MRTSSRSSAQQQQQQRRWQHDAAPPPLAAAAAAASSPTAAAATPGEQTALLDWLVRWQGATPDSLKVERRYAGEGLGWVLAATADAEPGEVLLSVPLTAAISSEGVDESAWSAAMADSLLRRRAEAAAAAAAGDELAAAKSSQAWLDALPAHVDLCWLYWTDAELAELQDDDTLAEARHMRGVYEAACEELGGRHSREDVAWALSLVHSRSFVMQSAHWWIPGIDMCNHTLACNADIRCVHSPGSCQGAAALDEVCPPDTAAAAAEEPSRFELVAGEAGIAAGEEVFISYGGWPSDVFLLFFGFVPDGNPHDSACLFYDLLELRTFQQRLAAGAGSDAAAAADEEEAVQAAEAAEAEAVVAQLEAELGPAGAYARMVATAGGLDERLLRACSAFLAVGRGSPNGRDPMTLPDFLAARCRQLLGCYPTSAAEDEALLRRLQEEGSSGIGGGAEQAAAAQAGVRRQQLQTAVRYRLGKKRVLQATLAAVTGGQG